MMKSKYCKRFLWLLSLKWIQKLLVAEVAEFAHNLLTCAEKVHCARNIRITSFNTKISLPLYVKLCDLVPDGHEFVLDDEGDRILNVGSKREDQLE
jgi:hypothetical protein